MANNQQEQGDAAPVLYHNESRWVAFTQGNFAGRNWNVTLREGMDSAELTRMLAMVGEASEALNVIDGGAGKALHAPGATGGSRNTAPAPSVPQNGSGRATGASGKRDANPQHIVRLEIAGTLDDPIVKMFGDNPALKFPIFSPKAYILQGKLADRYGGDVNVEPLGTCGMTMPVDWLVYWEPSPKNEKWKDILDVTIPKLEGGDQ